MARERDRKKSLEKPADIDEDSIRALLSNLEDDWMASRLRGEIESTERFLDESYRGTTSDGIPQSKLDFVRSLESSPAVYTKADHTDRTIGVYGDVVVSTGLATLISPDREHSFRYLRVYRKKGGEWRLVASQSTRLRAA